MESIQSQSILAIDPGQLGGMALKNQNGKYQVFPMPESMTEVVDLLVKLKQANAGLTVALENVGGYRPGNSGPAAVKFARHVGNIESALYALGIKTLKPVTPQSWMRLIGPLPAGEANKTARKKAIQKAMKRRFPDLKVTLKVSDALGILLWAEKQCCQNKLDWLD